MKYPRLPKEKWNKPKVLTESNIKEIKEFFAVRKNIRLTARTFGVSRHTVKYHTDDSFREREITNGNKRKQERYRTDPVYREKIIQQVKENQSDLRRRNPALSKYSTAMQTKRYHDREDVRSKVYERNHRYYAKKSVEIAAKGFAKKSPQELLKSYFRHKRSMDALLKVEPLLVLFH